MTGAIKLVALEPIDAEPGGFVGDIRSGETFEVKDEAVAAALIESGAARYAEPEKPKKAAAKAGDDKQ